MSRSARPLTSARVLHKISELTVPQKGVSCVNNRNPRNLERLRIAYKPTGYHLEKPGRSFWYKLEVNVSGKYVTADVKHFEDGIVLSASTSEWAIKKQLYKTNDTSAFINLGRVLAQRCLHSGIIEMTCNIKPVPDSKLDKLLKTVQANGVSFEEPTRFVNANPWDAYRNEKPWEVSEQDVAPLKK